MADEPDFMQRAMNMLGLPADADMQELLDAIAQLKTAADAATESATASEHPDPARFVPIEAVEYRLRVFLLMPVTSLSAASFDVPDFLFIFAPQWL